jgi:L-alanine-DL-glutamate epimerase-like enolase superfamily enzyme
MVAEHTPIILHRIETRIGGGLSRETAAAHLSPLVNYADLDGNLLIGNDPYRGVRVEKGKLILPDGPGLGLRRV